MTTGSSVEQTESLLLFESQVDKFTMEAVDLGQVFKLHVRHDNSLMGADWYLDQVEVLDMETEEVYMFLCERWLSTKKEDKRVERTFYVKVGITVVATETGIDSLVMNVFFVCHSGIRRGKKHRSKFKEDCSGQTGAGQKCQQKEKEEEDGSGGRGTQ